MVGLRKVGKLTREVEEQVQILLQHGATKQDTAAAVGVDYSTFYRWMQVYPHFMMLVKKAEAASRREAVDIIRKVARGGIVLEDVTTTVTNRNGTTTTRRVTKYSAPEWTAAAWYLERSDPDNWGRRDTLRIQREKVLEETRRYAQAQGLSDEETEAAVREAERMLSGR